MASDFPKMDATQYESLQLAPSTQKQNLLSRLEGTEGTSQEISAVQRAVAKLFPDFTVDGAARAGVAQPVIERLRTIFATHADLWKVFYKKQPIRPANMFQEENALAAEFADQETKSGQGEPTQADVSQTSDNAA